MRPRKEDTPPTPQEARVAACALLVELARADGDFSAAETEAILAILSREHGLSQAGAAELLQTAREEAAKSIDLWRFTKQLNAYHGTDEKLDIVELLWEVVYADGTFDDHEHYFMGKLTGLLNLEHARVIERKLRARDRARR